MVKLNSPFRSGHSNREKWFTDILETFPVGPNRSIQFYIEIGLRPMTQDFEIRVKRTLSWQSVATIQNGVGYLSKLQSFFFSLGGLRRRTHKDSWVRVRTVQNSCFGSLTRSRRRFQFCRHGMPVETNLLQDSFRKLSRVGRSRKCTSCVKVRSDCYDRPNRFNHRCHFKKWSYDRGDYMRTLHRRSLMLVAIGAIAISWSVRVLSGLFKADRGNREWFYENYFLTRRRSKRSKLSHGPSI